MFCPFGLAFIQATNLITKKELLSTDPDTDDKQLIYEITSGPRNGYVESKLNPGTAVATFTQGMELGCFLWPLDFLFSSASSSRKLVGGGNKERWERRSQGANLKGSQKQEVNFGLIAEICCNTQGFSKLPRAGDLTQGRKEGLQILLVDLNITRAGRCLASKAETASCEKFTSCRRGPALEREGEGAIAC